MSSSASVQMCTNPVSSTGPSSLKTMRVLSSNWLAEQLSTRRAHPVVMNSRALLFQASKPQFWSQRLKIAQPSKSRMNCLAMIALLLSIFEFRVHNTPSLDIQCMSDISSLLRSSCVQIQQEHLDFRPETKTMFNILALCRQL